MVAPGDPSGNMQIDILILAFIQSDELFQQMCPFAVRMRISQANAIKTVLEPAQMLSQAKRFAGIDRNNLIYPVTKNKAPIQHRNACFFDSEEIAVEIDHDQPGELGIFASS